MHAVTRRSMLSGAIHTMFLPITPDAFDAAFVRYQGGALLQDAFPMLPAPEREFVKTGITPEEWAGMFGPDDEEGDA